jgi:hypothetical protein
MSALCDSSFPKIVRTVVIVFAVVIVYAQPSIKPGDFPTIHIATPDENVQRAFLRQHALIAAEAERLPEAARLQLYSSVGAKLRLRPADVILILRESQRFSVDSSRESERLAQLPVARIDDARKVDLERIKVQSRLVREAMSRIRSGLDTRSRNRFEATLYTQFDQRPSAPIAGVKP